MASTSYFARVSISMLTPEFPFSAGTAARRAIHALSQDLSSFVTSGACQVSEFGVRSIGW
jgi:hypothetical protein